VSSEPLIHWPEPLIELLEFVATFLAAGAVGFRFVVLRATSAGKSEGPGTTTPSDAATRAAALGLAGAVLLAIRVAIGLPELAARAKTDVAGVVLHTPVVTLWVVLTLAAIVGFAAARARHGKSGFGWGLAAVGVIAGTLRNGLVGQWPHLVNPVHLLAAAFWIGRLFVLVVAGLPSLRRDAAGRRGYLVAAWVNAFSPFALTLGGVVALFGAITAWQHLKYVAALWTTPYGYTLIAKLCVVAVVLGLGAWNWRRQRPLLGTDAAATSLQRSATAELTVASIVLIITSILVSLPTPKLPGS
jgi:putative copper export protein